MTAVAAFMRIAGRMDSLHPPLQIARSSLLRSRLVAALPLAGLVAAAAFSPVRAATPATMPVDEVRPGMLATARTVFHGTRIETFDLRIIGVLRDVTPGGDLILARAEGDSLE